MSTVIAVTNQKGGVGKTTTAINVAFCLAKMGKKTLLIDLDPQGNATSGLAFDKQELKKTMTDVMLDDAKLEKIIQITKFKNLSLAPTTAYLANAEVELSKVKGRFTRLKDATIAARGTFDYIIVDNPPSLGLLTVNGLIAADYILLPVQTEFYALEGVSQLLESMKLVKKAMNPDLDLLGVVPTMVDARTTLSVQVLEEIQKFFGSKVFETFVPRNVRLAEAPSHGVPVGVYDRFSKGAKAYKALTKEIVKRVEQ
ncbi:ParA family protein [Candidatus Saccharibacteria bacterium]|nr:ParA family protein [Candidatus Saccharibacteria bacterium]